MSILMPDFKGTLPYFAYGANLHHRGMERRCPKATYVGPATLHNYRMVFRGVCDIERAHRHRVDGALWRVTADCLRSLDRFEGHPWLYRRDWVRVRNGKRELKAALVYIMTRRNKPLSPPSEGYLTTVAMGYVDCGLPQDRLIRAWFDSEDASDADDWNLDDADVPPRWLAKV